MPCRNFRQGWELLEQPGVSYPATAAAAKILWRFDASPTSSGDNANGHHQRAYFAYHCSRRRTVDLDHAAPFELHHRDVPDLDRPDRPQRAQMAPYVGL